MNIELKYCPLCESGQFNLFLKCKDYTTTGDIFNIVQCTNCSFLFTNPRPASESLGKYYESDQYISHTNQANNLINKAYKIARTFTIQQKSGLISKWSRKGKLLDVGCGTGEFIHYNKVKGWRVKGVEVNEQAREQAESLLSQELEKDLFHLDPKEKYDAITLWHVLEHVDQLNETVKRLHNFLKENGTLFLAVPNPDAYDAAYYKENWAAYDVPRHLYHFTKDTMSKLMQKYQLQVKQVLPMKLDAFYVSMLSEKYKTGKSRLAKASWTGLVSNIKAQQDNNYSSLIYIVTK